MICCLSLRDKQWIGLQCVLNLFVCFQTTFAVEYEMDQNDARMKTDVSRGMSEMLRSPCV